MKVKAILEIGRQSAGHYEEDDNGTEFYVTGKWTRSIVTKTIEVRNEAEIKALFDMGDGDEDSYEHLLFITLEDDTIIWSHLHDVNEQSSITSRELDKLSLEKSRETASRCHDECKRRSYHAKQRLLCMVEEEKYSTPCVCKQMTGDVACFVCGKGTEVKE